MGEAQHKPAIEVGKAQEAAKLCKNHRGWKVANDMDVGRIHMHHMRIHYVF